MNAAIGGIASNARCTELSAHVKLCLVTVTNTIPAATNRLQASSPMVAKSHPINLFDISLRYTTSDACWTSGTHARCSVSRDASTALDCTLEAPWQAPERQRVHRPKHIHQCISGDRLFCVCALRGIALPTCMHRSHCTASRKLQFEIKSAASSSRYTMQRADCWLYVAHKAHSFCSPPTFRSFQRESVPSSGDPVLARTMPCTMAAQRPIAVTCKSGRIARAGQ